MERAVVSQRRDLAKCAVSHRGLKRSGERPRDGEATDPIERVIRPCAADEIPAGDETDGRFESNASERAGVDELDGAPDPDTAVLRGKNASGVSHGDKNSVAVSDGVQPQAIAYGRSAPTFAICRNHDATRVAHRHVRAGAKGNAVEVVGGNGRCCDPRLSVGRCQRAAEVADGHQPIVGSDHATQLSSSRTEISRGERKLGASQDRERQRSERARERETAEHKAEG